MTSVKYWTLFVKRKNSCLYWVILISTMTKSVMATAELLETYNLVQHVQGPTHQSGHTLDLVITREDDGLILSPPVNDLYISDHVTLIFRIQLSKPLQKIKK